MDYTHLSDSIAAMNKLHSEVRTIDAIWLNKSIQTLERKKMRIVKGDLVCIKDGELVDCTGLASHIIVECRGTLSNSFSIVVEELSTRERTTVYICSV